MAFAAKKPGLVAVVFDLPNVLPLTREYIAGAGLTGRVTTAVGDYLVDPLPKGFDLVFLSPLSTATRQSRTPRCLPRAPPRSTPAGGLRSSTGSWTTTG